MTVEEKLAEWAKQPGAVVSGPEQQFIQDMRNAANAGVGYGWMQQVIEWEWQAVGLGAWGPEYFNARITELECEVERLEVKGIRVVEQPPVLGDPEDVLSLGWVSYADHCEAIASLTAQLEEAKKLLKPFSGCRQVSDFLKEAGQ